MIIHHLLVVFSGSGNFQTDNIIKLYLGGTYTTISDSFPNSNSYGYFDIIPNVAISDNTYSITVKVVDNAGNISTESSSLSITIDTVVPAKPGTPDLEVSFDTGNSATDNLTNLGTSTNNLDISVGSVTAGDSVHLIFGSTIVDREKVGSGNSSVTFTVNGQTQGDYNVTAIAYDPSGNASVSSEILAISIDTDAPGKPTIDLKASSDLGQLTNDDITSDQTPTLTIGNLTALDTIYIYDVGVQIQSEVVTATSMDITLTASLADGSHTLSAKAIDPAGNVSTVSSNLNITVDTSAPATPNKPDLKSISDSGFSSTDNYTSSTTPTFTISGVTATDSVILSIGGQTIDEISSGTSVEITVPVALTSGGYTASAVAYDLAGNASASSSNLSVTIDIQAPATPNAPDLMDASDTGRDNTDNITNETQPQLSISNVTSGDSLLLVFQNQSTSAKDTTGRVLASGTTASITSSSLTGNVTYDIYVIAKDQAGNTTDGTTLTSFVLDVTDPTVPDTPNLVNGSDTGILNNDDKTNDQTPSFSVSGITSGDSIVLTIGSEVAGNIASGDPITLTIGNNLASNTYSATAKAIDLAGNESGPSSALSIEIDATAPNAPSSITIKPATDTGFDNTDAITMNQQPEFTIGGLHSTNRDSIQLIFNDTLMIASGRTANGSSTIDLGPSSDQAEGTYSVTAVAIDSVGNVSDTSDVLTLEIDRTAPNAPSAPVLLAASDLGRLDSDNITNDDTPSFTISNITQNDSIYLIFNTDTVARVIATGTSMEVTADAVGDNTYSVKVLARDPAGNLSQASSTLSGLEIDTQAPTAPTTIVLKTNSDSGIRTDDRLTNNTTPEFTVSGVTNTDSILILIGGATVSSGVSTSSTIDLTVSSALTDGNYTVTSKSIDLAGNISIDIKFYWTCH